MPNPKRPPKIQADNTRVARKAFRPSADAIEAKMRSEMTPDAFDLKFGNPFKTKSIESYDETFLGNANVPNIKSTALPPGSPPPSTPNKTGATYQSDGTDNPRAETQTKQATYNSTPSGGKDQRPSGVDSFPERF